MQLPIGQPDNLLERLQNIEWFLEAPRRCLYTKQRARSEIFRRETESNNRLSAAAAGTAQTIDSALLQWGQHKQSIQRRCSGDSPVTHRAVER